MGWVRNKKEEPQPKKVNVCGDCNVHFEPAMELMYDLYGWPFSSIRSSYPHSYVKEPDGNRYCSRCIKPRKEKAELLKFAADNQEALDFLAKAKTKADEAARKEREKEEEE